MACSIVICCYLQLPFPVRYALYTDGVSYREGRVYIPCHPFNTGCSPLNYIGNPRVNVPHGEGRCRCASNPSRTTWMPGCSLPTPCCLARSRCAPLPPPHPVRHICPWWIAASRRRHGAIRHSGIPSGAHPTPSVRAVCTPELQRGPGVYRGDLLILTGARGRCPRMSTV